MVLQEGLTFKLESQVNENNTAIAVGSSNLQVFSTPMMIALMEGAAASCVKDYIGEDNTTVGIKIDVSHDSATPVGMKVYALATIINIDRKKIEFKVEAFDEIGKIGEGSHSRFIVNKNKFMEKVNSKNV